MPEKNKEVNFYGDHTPWTVENMVAASREVARMIRRHSQGRDPVITITPKAQINKQGGFSIGLEVERL